MVNEMSEFKEFRLDILAAICLAVAAIILFLPVMVGWQGIFHDDQAMEVFLRHYFLALNLQQGIIPLWEPHIWCGAIPFYARYYTNTYYILLWPFYLLANLRNLDQAYFLITILPLLIHFILGAIGMFVLLRRGVKCKCIPSLLGALAYIYSPTFVYAYVWQKVVVVQAWLPWLIYIYISTVRSWRLWRFFLGGLILAFIWTAGQPNYMPFVIIIWTGVILILIHYHLDSKRKIAFIKPLLIALAMFILGTALSGVYLYPFLEGIHYTNIHMELSADAAISDIAANIPPFYLATLFSPNLFGNVTGENFIIKPLMFWEANLSGGIGISLLVMLGLIISIIGLPGVQAQGQRKWGIMAGFLYLFAILCVLGVYTPFYRYTVGLMPGVGGLPHPIRYRMIQCFAAALLITIGLEKIITPSFLGMKHRLKRWVWFYTIISILVISIALMRPQGGESDNRWVGESDSGVDGYFALGTSVGTYTPKRARVKKIRAMFDGESRGEIRYCDNHNILPNEGILAMSYHVPDKGWIEFNIDIPPNKFIWISPEAGLGSIGYWKTTVHYPCFTYDNKWDIYTNRNAISLYLNIDKVRRSLISKLNKDMIVKIPILTSFLYGFFILSIIIINVRRLSPREFGYLLGIIVVGELFIFGTLAFYRGTFTYDIILPQYVRALRPSDHPLLQRMVVEVPAVATNPTLRLATDYPFYDNFCRLNSRFALMGYEMHPLERRFKHAIETAYGQPMDWSIHENTPLPGNISFLNHFSVGYFLTTESMGKFPFNISIRLSPNSHYYLHINPQALPRAYTIDRVLIASEEEQLKALVSGDLRKAVYVGFGEGIKSQGTFTENEIAHFKDIQEINSISKIGLDNSNQIDIDIEVRIPSMLVLTEVWYPGWEATVDGKSVPIYRVNYCQRGIWLEKGKHHVQFRFQPLARRVGMGISLGTIALVVGLWISTMVKQRIRR